MSAFAERAATLAGANPDTVQRLAGGDLSEVVQVERPDGRLTVVKANGLATVEAAMLRALAKAGAPVPIVEAEYDGAILMEYIGNDGVMSPSAWASLGEAVASLHANRGEDYGWPADYRLGSVELSNRANRSWPSFWAEQRLIATAALLDRPWRERLDKAAARLIDILPSDPPVAMLHGDLWSGNILVEGGRLRALIDPACYYGHAEVDLAMLHLFDTVPDTFAAGYGALEPGWEERRDVYQLFPALVHFRIFGATYAGLVDRLLLGLGA